MALVYPLALPTRPGFRSIDFRLLRRSSMARPGSGAVQTLELAEPLWAVTAETPILKPAERGVWRAFFDALRDGGKQFLIHDTDRPFPLEYATGFDGMVIAGTGTPFVGTALLTSVSGTALTVSNLPAGFVLSPGDYAGVPNATPRALFRVSAPAVANGMGGITFDVEPVPPQNLVGTITFAKPTCVMRLVPGTASAPADAGGAPASFQAVQDLR
jgi:hypothetical protein